MNNKQILKTLSEFIEIQSVSADSKRLPEILKADSFLKSHHLERCLHISLLQIFPSLDIHGIVTSYTGKGPKTVIPCKATAKFSCRVPRSQKNL